MAEGKWVNIPGKGRRWQQPSGELMMTKPGFGQGEFFQTRAAEILGGIKNFISPPGYVPRGPLGTLPGGPTAATGKQKNSNTFSDPAGREKITNAWGNLQSPDFGYIAGQLPSYQDAQGNVYDAVSGRLMWRTGSKGSSSASASNLGSRNPSERAYQAEASRVAQLTAQDPELQRYEAARKLAVAPGATPEQVQSAENIGMQIWQQKYGNTPMGQPGGAVGRNNPLMDRTFGYQSGSAPGQQMGEPTIGPSPLVPQVDQSLNPASPNYIGGEGAPLMNFADPRFENMSPEDFQKLLNQVNKK